MGSRKRPRRDTVMWRAILKAMDKHDVRRLVVVSVYGAGDSRDRSLYARLTRAMLGQEMLDKDRMEGLIRASSVDWTSVRPPRLTKGPHTGAYRTGTDLPVGFTSSISRAALAEFLLGVAVEGTYVRETPAIAPVRKTG